MYRSRSLFIRGIRLYQATISPDHGAGRQLHRYGYCRFYPSCSEYAAQAIERYGVIQGSIRALWRVLRCNPWSHGGVEEMK